MLAGDMLDDLNSLYDYLQEDFYNYLKDNGITNEIILEDLAIVKMSTKEQDLLDDILIRDKKALALRDCVYKNRCLMLKVSTQDDNVDLCELCNNWARPITNEDIESQHGLNYALAIYRTHVDEDVELPLNAVVGVGADLGSSKIYDVQFNYGSKEKTHYNVEFQDYAYSPYEDENVLHRFFEKLYKDNEMEQEQ